MDIISLLTYSLISAAYGFIVLVLASFLVIVIYKSLPRGRITVTPKLAVVVTGCDTGFGHQLATRLDGLGFTVFAGCLFKDGEGAKKLKSKCTSNLKVVSLDVTSDESVKAAAKYVEDNLTDKTKGLWAICNNAGIWKWGAIEWCPLENFKLLAEVNIYGMVRTTQAFLPMIRRAKGRVVNVGSISGIWSPPSNGMYCMTKHAVESFSDSLRYEMHRWGVKVSIIQPGHFGMATSIGNKFEESIEELWGGMREEIKRDYGRSNFDGYVQSLRDYIKATDSDHHSVVDQMVNAIVSRRPKHRYLIGPLWNTQRIAYACRFLPTFIMDREFYSDLMSYPKPASLLD